ncbi:amidohydrolase [Paraburkholderia sp. MPAMCS5]|uniref:amidohydrolase family protein n=1 Tax=Paraburkholderia sp. MPAMCS5 TaxID=3112563 RepID=UPI002E19629C|nr:amidohydrolase [Paraburkholderia sp. MPAMCS5]
MDNFPIIDPHHHLYDLKTGNYPWLQGPMLERVFGDYSAIRQDYLIENFLADIKNQNVVKTVHLQVEYDHNDPVAETRWLQSVADKHGYPHGIVGFADLSSPDVQQVLEAHLEFPNVRGIRQCLNFHRDPVKTFIDSPHLMSDPQWRAGYALLKRYDLSFDLQLYYTQMEEATALARYFPDTAVVLNHTGMPVDRLPDEVDAWKESMTLLASAPNVFCKISGLGMGDWKWTVDSIRPFVLHAIEAFGVERCMFASNFPVDKLFSSYDEVFNAFKSITTDFSPAERAALFHYNAERVYRL